MCVLLGLEQGWWNIAGIAIEIAGFLFLFRPTLNDVRERERAGLYGRRPFDATNFLMHEKDKAETLVKRTWLASRPVFVGASLVMVGLVLQIPGNWPC